ncbi:MAG TPA: Flp family type IVb pilin [Stellaceae bacterium]|jgi:pilus assembly protein Flp/PilA|nr:Flp family type IVb pilin [Stellaceae bacterium]
MIGFEAVGLWRMRAALIKALRSDSGVSAIEYAMIGGLIAIAIVTGATQIGGSLTTFFTDIANSF